MDDEVTVWDVVDIEALLTSSNFPQGMLVAIVDRNLHQEGNSNAFSELYLSNRGWHRIKMFDTRDLALAWLHSGDRGKSGAMSSGDS